MTGSISAIRVLTVLLGLSLLSACQADSREQLLKTGKSQVALRSIQSREFDTTDREKTLRTVIATMQDLGFVVDKADAVLGSVSGTKFDNTTSSLPYRLRMTVTIRRRGETRIMVRANAQYNITPVEDPEPYQNFFSALSKAMFLDAHMIGDRYQAARIPAEKKTDVAAATTRPPDSAIDISRHQSAIEHTKSPKAAAPLPRGSIIDFAADREAIETAISNYYFMGGYSNEVTDNGYDAVAGMEMSEINALTVEKIDGDEIDVSAEYIAVSGSNLGSVSLKRKCRFLLRKQHGSFTVIKMWGAQAV